MLHILNNLFKFSICLFFFWLALILLIATSTYLTNIPEKFTFGNNDTNGYSHQRSQEFQKWIRTNEQKKKGIIIGSSTAFRNIIPDSLDSDSISWFNLGSSLQTLDNSKIILEHICKKYHIDFVFIDYYPQIEKYSSFESCYDLIKNSTFDNVLKTKLILHSTLDLSLINQFVYRFIKNALNGKVYLKNETWCGDYMSRGFVAMTKEAPINISTYEKKKIPLNESKTLSAISEFLEKNKLPYVINIAPNTETSFELDYFMINKKKLYEEKLFQSPLINTFYYDSHHMTLQGASNYSQLIKNNLRNNINW